MTGTETACRNYTSLTLTQKIINTQKCKHDPASVSTFSVGLSVSDTPPLLLPPPSPSPPLLPTQVLLADEAEALFTEAEELMDLAEIYHSRLGSSVLK